MDLFKRDISFTIEYSNDKNILIRNTLKDIFHDIVLNVYVNKDTLVITDIKVNFYKGPTSKCQNIQARLEELIGITIGKGLTNKIFEATSGGQGCINVRNMLLSSLPIILNIKAGQGARLRGDFINQNENILAGTCIGYS